MLFQHNSEEGRPVIDSMTAKQLFLKVFGKAKSIVLTVTWLRANSQTERQFTADKKS